MRKFMAIIKKDWHLSRKTILLQVWIAAAIWFITIVGGIAMYAIIKAKVPEADMQGADFKEIWSYMGDLIVYMSNLYQVLLPGLLGLVVVIGILIGALNGDMRKNCEIFYRTQPVSLWWRALSKYIVGFFFTMVVMLGLTLVQFVLSNLVLQIYVDGVDWGLAFTGTMQYWFYMFFGTMLTGSLAWFFSAVFREHAFFKTAGIVLGVGLLLIMINIALSAAPFIFNGWSTDFRVPELTKLLFDYPIADMRLHDTFQANIKIEDPSDFNPAMMQGVVSGVWHLIWGWDTLVKVLVSAGLFFAGTWIYIRKEVL